MDNGGKYEGITDFKTMKLYAELKTDIAELKTFIKTYMRKSSERMEDEWINGLKVMKILKITKGTLQSYRNKGVLPFKRNRGKIYYKSEDVASLFNSNNKKPPRKVKRYQGANHY